MPYSLFKFLFYNRKGDRIGRGTKVYLILWAIVIPVSYILVHGLQWFTVEQADPWWMGFCLSALLTVPFNLRDK
jgi:hypothetical protein